MDVTVSRLKIFSIRALRTDRGASEPARSPRTLVRIGVLALLGALGACAAADPPLPRPRPIIIHSGERIRADYEEMEVVNEWVTREQTNITEDPSFWVITTPVLEDVFPWDGMVLGQDSVTLSMPLGGRDGQLVYQLYGHMHLMVQMGRQEEWIPEAPAAVGYELERAIVSRVADAWILGRTVFDTQPFTPLDELAYSKNSGFLDAFIFTARPDEFAASRAEWARANPERMQEYRDWFLETFNTEPPGIRTN